jgi:hypothetical protein
MNLIWHVCNQWKQHLQHHCWKLHTLQCDAGTWQYFRHHGNWGRGTDFSHRQFHLLGMSRHTQPRSKSEGFPDKKLRNDVISKFRKNLRRDTWTYSTNTMMHSALTNTTWVWPKTSRTKFTSNHIIQSTRSNSRSWRHTTNSADKLGMNGWNWELSRGPNSLYNSPIFCVPKKQGQRLQIIQDFWELNQIEVGECNTVVKRISNCLSMKPCSTGKPCCQL